MSKPPLMYSWTTPLLVDEHTHRQPEHPELIGDFVVTIHEDRKRMAVLLDVLTHFRIVFQLIDRQHHKALVTKLVDSWIA